MTTIVNRRNALAGWLVLNIIRQRRKRELAAIRRKRMVKALVAVAGAATVSALAIRQARRQDDD
jgi:hypothetical protein